jgi:nucleotide-binding universal stress UspA family protein
MRSIVVAADRSRHFEGRLQTALSLARTHASHLTVLIDTPLGEFMTTDAYGGAHVAADAMREAYEADQMLAQRLDARLAREDVPFDIVEEVEDPVAAICEAGMLTDLIVADVGAPRLGELVVSTSTPVLAIPSNPRPAPLNRIATVAWDSSPAAARALRAAAPLLAKFEAVHVITVVKKERRDFPPIDVMQYLARHGVAAEYHEYVCYGSVEETLAREVGRLRAQLLVMGAYGHSRLREFLTGGVTRYFLTDRTVPLFLAH